MSQDERRFKMEPFELPEGTIVRASGDYPGHIHFTDPYGGEVNLPVRDTHLAVVRLLFRLARFLPGVAGAASELEEVAPAYRDLRGRTVPAFRQL